MTRIGNLLIIILSFFISSKLTSQYTEQINSNRPGYSIGAFSVGKGVIQVETGPETDPCPWGSRYARQKHKQTKPPRTLSTPDPRPGYQLGAGCFEAIASPCS